jgi:hypothetical protein
MMLSFITRLAAGAENRDFSVSRKARKMVATLASRSASASLFLDSSLLLIEPVTAAGYAETQRAAEDAARPKPADHVPGTTGDGGTPPRVEDSARPTYASGGSAGPQAARSSFTAASSSMPSKRKSNLPTSSMKSSCNSPRGPA